MARCLAVPRTSRRRLLVQSGDAFRLRHALALGLDRALDPADVGDHGRHLCLRSCQSGAAAMSALVIIFATMAFALWLGILARRGRDMDLEQWTVGGRGF